MLATKLSRARLELQAHRIWLRGFGLRSNALSSSFSTTTPGQKDISSRKSKPSQGLSSRSRSPRKYQAAYETNSVYEDMQRQITNALGEDDFDEAMKIYRSIEKKRFIAPPVLNHLTQRISYFAFLQLSTHGSKQDSEQSEKMQQYAEELIEDIRKGTLRPSPIASSHLIDYCVSTSTWDIATRFWEWLEAQSENHVGPAVYASAILLKAAQDAKLEDLEALYEQGLARFPGNFAAYHFSPGAIVPNRDGDMIMTRMPTPILLAIMQARLMRGDSNNAYLALDAMLRLKPTGNDPHFFAQYQKERPVSEAYTVFAMACRAGNALPINTYRGLLAGLRTNADVRDVRRFVLTIRAMLSATYLQIGAGGKLTRNAVTEIIILLSTTMRVKGVFGMPEEERLQLAQVVQELIGKTLELAARFSSGPTIAAYNSIIYNIAGVGQAEATITTAIREALVHGLEPTIVTRRSIISAAGSADDGELVKKAWKWLVQARTREGSLPDTTDLHVLAKACSLADIDSFASDAINAATYLEDWQKENLLERLEKLEERTLHGSTDRGQPADLNELLAEVAKIKEDLEVFDTNTSDAKGAQDFTNQTLPVLLFPPPKDVRLPEHEMRRLYEELSTDPNPPPQESLDTSQPAPKQVSTVTKVPFGQLRYENWKLITYLLAEAHEHDKSYVDAVDAALAKGERPPQRNYGQLFEGEEKVTGVGLSDSVKLVDVSDQEIDVEKARARICELRKVDLPTKAV